MKLVRQPPRSNCCGQACIATIFDITLEESIKAFGTRGCTRARDLIAAAIKLQSEVAPHWSCGDRLINSRNTPLPKNGTAVAKFRLTGTPGWKSHWVVYHNGKYYDPAAGVFRKVPEYLEHAKLTSWLPFYDTSTSP